MVSRVRLLASLPPLLPPTPSATRSRSAVAPRANSSRPSVGILLSSISITRRRLATRYWSSFFCRTLPVSVTPATSTWTFSKTSVSPSGRSMTVNTTRKRPDMRTMPAARASHTPRTALVTGGNRGIGLEVCRRLGGLGLKVLLAGRSRNAVEEAAALLREEGSEVEPRVLDVTDEASVRQLSQALETELGGVDVLVNNAAVLLGEDASVLAAPIDDFRRSMEANVYG